MNANNRFNPVNSARPAKTNTMGGDYLGEDLKRAPVRAGAMDAFKLPSLEFGKTVERKAPR